MQLSTEARNDTTLPRPTEDNTAETSQTPPPAQLSSKALYLRLLSYVKPYWVVFLIAIVAMVVLALTEPAMPALIKPLLDGSFVEKDPDLMQLMPILIVLLFFIRGVANYISTVAINWVANKVVMDLRNEMFNRLMTLPSSFYDHHPAGNLMSKVTFDVTQVTNAASQALIVIVRDSIAIIGLLAWMFYLNWRLTLLALIVAPAIALVVKVISKRLRKFNRKLQSSMGDMTHCLEESIGGVEVIKVYQGREQAIGRFQKISNWVRRYNMKLISASAASVPIVQFIAAIALAMIIYIAIGQSAANEITVGGFVSFFGAMAMLFSPLKRLTKVNEQLQKGLAAAESVFGLLDETPETDTGGKPILETRGQIEFRHVTLNYQPDEPAALHDFTLTVNAGETLALVGQSGSGKSTLVQLIPRFYRPGSGQILIDGEDIETLKLDALRQRIAVVNQDIVLFNDTVAANIAFGGLHEASREEIIRAAEAAHAMEFIEKLPDGLDTMIGSNGVRLSGGQRQRLAIARALLKNAPILILDEATSALDTASEHHVQKAIEGIRHSRTLIIIAHRLSTIKNADRIAVLNQGKLAELGPHQRLLDEGGLYAQLYRKQLLDDELKKES